MSVDRDAQSDALIIPKAGKGTPLQTVRWSGQRAAVTTSGSSQRITLPAGSKVIEITAVTDAYLNFGDNTVEATSTIANDASRLMLAGVQVIPVLLDPATGEEYTHVAVLQSSTPGIFQVEQVS